MKLLLKLNQKSDNTYKMFHDIESYFKVRSIIFINMLESFQGRSQDNEGPQV